MRELRGLSGKPAGPRMTRKQLEAYLKKYQEERHALSQAIERQKAKQALEMEEARQVAARARANEKAGLVYKPAHRMWYDEVTQAWVTPASAGIGYDDAEKRWVILD
jgi:hypothetical protein